MLDKGRSPLVILAVIVGIALLLSIFSYQYSILTSNKIRDIASQEVRSNARIEVHGLTQILGKQLQTVSALLQTLTPSPLIQNDQNQKSAFVLFNSRQNSTNDLTNFYMWLDRDGKIVWISNMNHSTYQKYRGTDLSYRPYFTVPKDTHKAYYSSLIDSNDKVPRLYISYPIINSSTGIFKGVVVSGINVYTLGNLLKIFPQFNSTIGLLDRNGIILYTNPQQYVGDFIFGNKFQSLLSSLLRPPESITLLNNLIRTSLQGYTGVGDILANGKMSTIAYEPVLVKGQYFLTLYISAQHNLATDVSALIDQQRYFTTIIIAIIEAVAIIIAFLVFSWNKRLATVVNTRTADLKTANDSLALANEQLKVHDKMQQEFINVASHEMKTPTQAILGYSKLIRRHPEKREVMMEAIARNASRLQRLTNDILDVTRIETQSLKLNIERVNLNELISDLIEDYRNEIEKTNKDIKILHEPQNQIIDVEADKNRLTQVISNLLSNAIKFTMKGTIRVTEEVKDGKVLVSIKDTGQGIDTEIFPRLFLKFAAKSETGTGLGLFISKSIVEAHGGKIWAENNADHDGKKGATLTFSIPLSKLKEAKLRLRKSNDE
ncbi:MAG TPA: sensor histidine kinase [Candidatus Acidoferrum sp.]|nr:sensor histidine kinase [Candidatus Acidoferrum sp.]